MEIKKQKNYPTFLPFPEINPFLTELSCSALLQKALPKSQIFWRVQTVSPLFPVSGKWDINIENTEGEILVHGKGLHGLSGSVRDS